MTKPINIEQKPLDLSIEEIAAKFRKLGIPPKFDVCESKFIVALLQEVARGKPLTQKKSYEIASELNLSQEQTKLFLELYTERNDEGDIVGLFGLSQNEYAHKFEIGGRNLSTFCAWDTLFLPLLLNKTAKVKVVDPHSKETVRVEISPQGVFSLSPQTAVLSIVIPDDDIETLEQAYQIFCVNVRFFASEKNLRKWFEQGEYKPLVLSLEDGYALGKLSFGNIAEDVYGVR